MSVYPTDAVSLDSRRAADALATAGAYALATLKWVIVLNLAVGWVAFWANVIRLHWSQGDTVAAAITVVVFLVPPIVGVTWLVAREVGLAPDRLG